MNPPDLEKKKDFFQYGKWYDDRVHAAIVAIKDAARSPSLPLFPAGYMIDKRMGICDVRHEKFLITASIRDLRNSRIASSMSPTAFPIPPSLKIFSPARSLHTSTCPRTPGIDQCR